MTLRWFNGELIACEPPQADQWENLIGAMIAAPCEVPETVARYRVVTRRKVADIDEWLTAERTTHDRRPAVFWTKAQAVSRAKKLRRNGQECRIIREVTQLSVLDD